jgi:hypothetical protein
LVNQPLQLLFGRQIDRQVDNLGATSGFCKGFFQFL